MALQGTLETFALPDVLHLLSSTKKTGVLRVETDRGTGELLVDDGALTGGSVARAPRAEQPADVLFELLRSADGTFLFDADAAPGGGEPVGVDVALAAAEEQLAEWHQIEAVVPSPYRLVSLVGERDAPITLDPPQWRTLSALRGGCTVDELGERLALTELAVARIVRDLVELGAVELSADDVSDRSPAPAPAPAPTPIAEEPPAPAVDLTPAAPVVEPEIAPAPPVAAAPPEVPYEPLRLADPPQEPTSSGFGHADDGTGLPPFPGVDRPSAAAGAPAAEPLAPVAPLFGAPGTESPSPSAPAGSWENGSGFASSPMSSFFDDDDEDPLADDPFGPDPFRLPRLPTVETANDPEAAEMARQLANLSPRAAQAVAAAAAASTAEEREQALAQVAEDGEDPVNRGLLLKFLSSVEE